MHAPDPEQLYGVKIASIIAGFCGSVIALSLTSTTSLWRALTSVIGGTASAAYVTPVTIEVLHDRFSVMSAGLENATAFWIGLTAMRAVPIVINGTAKIISQVFRMGTHERE